MTDSHKNYLLDLGGLLREKAIEAKRCVTEAKGTDDESFQKGRQMAYYEVISLMQQQAEAFQIPASEIKLAGIDPDRDIRT